MYIFLYFSRAALNETFTAKYDGQAGLAARSGTMFTRSPHRNSPQVSLQVKKFGRVRLSANFPQNKYGGECSHGRIMRFLLVFKCCGVQPSRRGFHEWNFWTSGGVMYEQFMGDFTYRDSASRQVQLFISFVNFRATSLVSISYIFPPTVVLRTLFLILNICYELTILVWVLQQSYGNVH